MIGSAFYVMDYVEGRIFWDAALPEVAAAGRRAIYEETTRVLAALHAVDYAALGLCDYGKTGHYISRQVARWTQQYRAAETQTIDAMERLIEWLPLHIPAGEETCLVHGDFRLDNTDLPPARTAHSTRCSNWELSTLGHPLVDLAYLCMRYHLPADELRGLGGADAAVLLLPTEAECIADYCRRRGREPIAPQDWTYYLAFCMFRLEWDPARRPCACPSGNASSATALQAGRKARPLAELAWRLVQQSAGG